MKAHLQIQRRANPFNGIDGVALKRGIQLARRQVGDRHAHFRHNLAGKAGGAHFQAFQVLQRLDLFPEPATHLIGRVATREGQQPEGFIYLLHQLHAVVVVEPGIHLRCNHAEGYGGEVHGVGNGALVVIRGGVAHVVLAVTDQIENTERGLVLVGGINPDLQPTARHFLGHGRHVAGRIPQQPGIGAPGFRETQGIGFFRDRERTGQQAKSADRRQQGFTQGHSVGFHCYRFLIQTCLNDPS